MLRVMSTPTHNVCVGLCSNGSEAGSLGGDTHIHKVM